MSVVFYILNFQVETSTKKFQSQICINHGDKIYDAEFIVERGNFIYRKNKVDHLNQQDDRLFYVRKI